jgi:hypothetical protein
MGSYRMFEHVSPDTRVLLTLHVSLQCDASPHSTRTRCPYRRYTDVQAGARGRQASPTLWLARDGSESPAGAPTSWTPAHAEEHRIIMGNVLSERHTRLLRMWRNSWGMFWFRSRSHKLTWKPGQLSQYSDKLRAGRSGFDFRQRQHIFLCSTTERYFPWGTEPEGWSWPLTTQKWPSCTSTQHVFTASGLISSAKGQLYRYLSISSYDNTKGLPFAYIKLHGLSPRANYTDRATAACRRSDCQLLRIKGATWSAWRVPMAVFSVF